MSVFWFQTLLLAQASKPEFYFNIQLAKLMKHSDKFKFEPSGNSFFYSAAYQIQTSGAKPWHRHFNFPAYGIEAKYVDLGSPEQVLGQAVGLNPFLDFKVGRKPRSEISLGFGFGIAYVFKPYEIKTNPLQVNIGSKLNNLVSLRFQYELDIYKKQRLQLGVGILHLSNGSFKSPNLGLNYYLASVGYKLVSNDELKQLSDYTREASSWSFSLGTGIGWKEVKVVGGPKFPIYNLSGDVAYHFNDFQSIHGGVDLEYHKAFTYFAVHTELVSEIADAAVAGVRVQSFASYECIFGHLLFEARAGYNIIKTKFYYGEPFYTKFLFTYKLPFTISDRLHVHTGIYLKNHYFTADHFAVYLGIRWHKITRL